MKLARYLFRIFYNGSLYNGYQKQPNGNSIENHVEIAMFRSELIDSFRVNDYKAISRTDTQVSAFGNMFSILCKNQPNLDRINSYFPKDGSLVIISYALVDNKFNRKKPIHKVYGYFFPLIESEEIEQIHRMKKFIGKRDYSSFIKKGGAGSHNTITTIFDIQIIEITSGALLIMKGDRFGREQIRRMIGFILNQDLHNLSVESFMQSPLDIPMRSARPDRLVLLNIRFGQKIVWSYSDNYELIRQDIISYISSKPILLAFEHYLPLVDDS